MLPGKHECGNAMNGGGDGGGGGSGEGGGGDGGGGGGGGGGEGGGEAFWHWIMGDVYWQPQVSVTLSCMLQE